MKATILIYIITISLSFLFGMGMANSVDAQCIGWVYYEVIFFFPYIIILITIGATTKYLIKPLETVIANCLIIIISFGASIGIMSYKNQKSKEKYFTEENAKGEIFKIQLESEIKILLIQIPNSPHKDSLYYKLGELSRYEEGDKAVSYFEKAIEINPDYAEAYSELGRRAELYQPRNYKKAIEYYEKAVKLDSVYNRTIEHIQWLKKQVKEDK